MDSSLTTWINGWAGQSALLDNAMILISQTGVPVMVLFVVLHWWARQERRHLRHVAVTAGLAFLLGLGLNQLVLLFLHRIRPYDMGVTHLLIAPSADWSFPSDHATAAFAIVLAFVAQGAPRRTLALLALASLICLSRVYLGIHYVSDIAGGVATAAVATWIVRRFIREGANPSQFLTSIL